MSVNVSWWDEFQSGEDLKAVQGCVETHVDDELERMKLWRDFFVLAKQNLLDLTGCRECQ